MSTFENFLNFMESQEQWAQVVVCNDREVDNFVYSSALRYPNLTFRIIRSNRCQNSRGLFGEFSAALQFPYYFGGNWDAFNDCINDLQWIPSDGYVIVISESELLLSKEKNRRPTLLDILQYAAKNWAQWVDSSNPAPVKFVPFKVMFQFTRLDRPVWDRITHGSFESALRNFAGVGFDKILGG